MNDLVITHITIQPQDASISKNDIGVASAMEIFIVEVKDCLQPKDSQAKDTDYLYNYIQREKIVWLVRKS